MAKTKATLAAGALVALFASLTASLLVWLQNPEDSWLPNLLENILEASFLLLSVLGLAVVASLVVVASLGLVATNSTTRPSRQSQSIGPRPLPLDQYRMAVKVVWADRELSMTERDWLRALEREFNLPEYQVADIERQVMEGKTKEEVELRKDEPIKLEQVLYYPDHQAHYHVAVEMAWADEKLNKDEKDCLSAFENHFGLLSTRAADIEREVMGGRTKEEIPIDEPLPSPHSKDEASWMKLVEECVGVVDELDRHMTSLDPQHQELADHVILRLGEVLERSGVDVISDDAAFDSRRHRPERAGSRTSPGATITETLSPGFAVGRRVLRRARVQVE